jgi:hypothetical protein
VLLIWKTRRDTSGSLAIQRWLAAWSTPDASRCTRIVDACIVGACLGISAADCAVGASVCYEARTVVDHDADVLPDAYWRKWWWWTTAYEGISLAVYNS